MTDVERLARVLCAEFGDGFTPWDGLNALSTSTPPREAGEEAEPRLIQELRDGIGIHDNPNLRDEWGHDLLVAWSRLTRGRDEARETNKRLNRRAQEAEAARGRVEFFRDMIAAQARAQVAEDRENAARAEAARLREAAKERDRRWDALMTGVLMCADCCDDGISSCPRHLEEYRALAQGGQG